MDTTKEQEHPLIHYWLWPSFDQSLKGFDWNTACGLPANGLKALAIRTTAYWDKVTCPKCLAKKDQLSRDD